ncbi:MAG: PUR family DNA/RNA-binding protein [Bacteroidales bacterium]|jgi:hypothetical protein|nr:PUR family DNA/RNA-binding protein [Bacteroidales bacterium]
MHELENEGTIENKEGMEKNEIVSRSVRAGKRTYFFDLKTSKKDELYLTITESKRRFNEANGTYFYEKHKVFLLEQDVKSFHSELGKIIDFIEANPHLTMSDKNKEFDINSDSESLY